MDATVMPDLRRQRGAPPAPCAGLQHRQLHADVGDAEGGLKKAFSSDWEKWERVCQAANCHRHAPNPIKYPPPEPPVELDEAREFILSVIPRLLA